MGLSSLPGPFERPVLDKTQDFFENIKEHIESLQRNLNVDEQLVIYYHGPSNVVRVDRIEYRPFDLIIVHGQDSQGNPYQICTHAHSLNLSIKVQKVEEAKPKREIGFHRY